MTVYIALDDTDMPDSPGTGRLAREICGCIGDRYSINGITRHQLFVHPDIPYTSHNSVAVIHMDEVSDNAMEQLFEEVIHLVKTRSVPGSDPGVCMARHTQVTPSVIIFGKDAKSCVLTREQAHTLASNTGIRLLGLDGTQDGVIGALAGVGLAACGNDGRYLLVGTIRDLHGEADVSEIQNAGISTIISLDGRKVTNGRILFGKFPQPVRIGAKPVLLVREEMDGWVVERRD